MTTITHVSTLFEYDGPQLFEARDTAGSSYLGLPVPSPDAGEERCLVVSVTAGRLREFRDGQIDLRSVILEAAEEVWYLAKSCPDLGQDVQVVEQETPLSEEDLLPNEGFFLGEPSHEPSDSELAEQPALVFEKPSVSTSASDPAQAPSLVPSVTTDRFDKLVTLLKELFQLDKPDLDFGFYRIMHAKAAEVTQFLEHDLLPQVREAFSAYRSSDRRGIQLQLAKAKEGAAALGVPPADVPDVPKVRELEEQLEETAVDLDALEADVYDHIYRFFRRYYSEGDFLSNRVYKDGVYAIPYQGEEIKLHWANADQYYIKTSEYLRDYSFRLRPDDERNPMRVHFRLADATEGEHGNIKSAERRHFILAREDPIHTEAGPDGDEVVIRFEYRPSSVADWHPDQRSGKKRPPKQAPLLDDAEARILNIAAADVPKWAVLLSEPHVKPDGSAADYSRLRAHLNRYTARNTFDYFIHKDLGGFLRRELDFYLKNEVMHLDDIEHAGSPRVEQYLSKLRVIRRIASKIITFLAQLEDFQKKLWLKKKFVVETSWCIRVGCIPDEFLAEIATNDAQRAEWVDLCGINAIEGDLAMAGYTDPLTPEFLRQHPTLMVDTRHFAESFRHRLLEAVGDLVGQIDGTLIHSENFQALSLLQARFADSVKCVYLDPPYNSKTTRIAYKNTYKHSSWLALLENRLALSKRLAADDGCHIVAIDENEQERLGQLLSSVFPDHNKICTVVMHNKKGIQGALFSYNHEYAYFCVPTTVSRLNAVPIPEADWTYANLRKWGRESERQTARNCFYPIKVRGDDIVGFGDVCPDDWHPPAANVKEDDVILVYPVDAKGVERKWRYSRKSVPSILSLLRVKRTGTSDNIQIHKAKAESAIKTVWTDAKYIAGDHGTRLLTDLGLKLSEDLYPKSIHTVMDALQAVTDRQSVIVDYFAGSGTTGHAVINQNRQDGGSRRFVLVEMGHHFESILLPRLKKVTYSTEWEGGTPSGPATGTAAERSPRIMKVVRLESYEDVLNNIEFSERGKGATTLTREGAADGTWQEEYCLRYMLEVEAGEAESLLRLGDFRTPDAYRLRVKVPGSDESREVNVDLVETFNWLTGIAVARVRGPRRYRAVVLRDEEGRLRVVDGVTVDEGGPWQFRSLEGVLPDGSKAVLIWRNRPGGDDPEGLEEDNAVLNAWFEEAGYAEPGAACDVVYVNGDQNLQSLKPDGATWTARMIEADFRRLMFESEDA